MSEMTKEEVLANSTAEQIRLQVAVDIEAGRIAGVAAAIGESEVEAERVELERTLAVAQENLTQFSKSLTIEQNYYDQTTRDLSIRTPE